MFPNDIHHEENVTTTPIISVSNLDVRTDVVAAACGWCWCFSLLLLLPTILLLLPPPRNKSKTTHVTIELRPPVNKSESMMAEDI
jgi:hypothetical protein